ncbi:hypothetical protein SAMN05216238_101124 [Lentibacillus persicus]|uniref:Uncharacterized protein n=1 Tax=Lentibacillus persicus TaxID=640948 RepID=A0A1I1RYV0_9BACI|nr:hypothetical protein [Lentibacillus persicus]SFD39257.1 hypothetical protein SAMN05216238_101124 [Lentibacillus persicus]
MGYILPINHYQYYDYQRRTIKEKQDPIHIEKPYKTILRTEYNNQLRNQTATGQNNNTDLKLTKPKSPAAEKMYAELTGKGQHFSTTV